MGTAYFLQPDATVSTAELISLHSYLNDRRFRPQFALEELRILREALYTWTKARKVEKKEKAVTLTEHSPHSEFLPQCFLLTIAALIQRRLHKDCGKMELKSECILISEKGKALQFFHNMYFP